MVDLERWKNEIIDSIKDLHDETKKIREYLEDEQEEQEEQDEQDEQDEQEEEDEQEAQYVEDDQEYVNEIETVIIQKLNEIDDSINILNKTVVEGSLVVSISIVIALAFHYFVNQISKW